MRRETSLSKGRETKGREIFLCLSHIWILPFKILWCLKSEKKSGTVLYFCKSFIVWLNRKQLNFPSFLHSLCCDTLFWLQHMKKSGLYRHLVRKGSSSLTAFSSNCRYPSLILHQNSTSENFLKIKKCGILTRHLKLQALWHLKLHQRTFHILYIHQIHWPILHVEWIFYPSMIL